MKERREIVESLRRRAPLLAGMVSMFNLWTVVEWAYQIGYRDALSDAGVR